MARMTQVMECSEHWQAIDPERNIARDYRLSASIDLFGWIIVERRWGRIGAKGQSASSGFPTALAAEQFMQAFRTRRAGAARRSGVGYMIVDL